MVRYFDVADVKNYSKLSVNTTYNDSGMYQCYTRTFLLYLMMPYLYTLDHSVNVGAIKVMLLIGNPVELNH